MSLENTWIIPLNFGRPRVVDPYNGMTVSDFDLVAKEWYEVEFEDERVDGNVSELNYFYNLWNDTLRHAAKVGGGEPCFDSFMAKIAYDGLDATYRPVGVGA